MQDTVRTVYSTSFVNGRLWCCVVAVLPAHEFPCGNQRAALCIHAACVTSPGHAVQVGRNGGISTSSL